MFHEMWLCGLCSVKWTEWAMSGDDPCFLRCFVGGCYLLRPVEMEGMC